MNSNDNTTKEQAASIREVGHVQPGLLAAFIFGKPTFLVTPVGAGRIVVGRGSDSTVVLPDERLSRQHVAIAREGTIWRIEDLGSRNGTYVNGQRLTGPWQGQAPRTVRVGQTVLVPFEDITPLGQPHRLFDPNAVLGPTTQAAHDIVADAARTGHNVLVIGETGVGKELVAGVFHQASGRSGPFRTLNCAAVAEHLLESELFGHARGAFSGAAQARVGLFESAHGGTLFLDELGEMPLPMQAKLLRTIQEKEVRRVGENDVRRVDVRLIAATNRDLAERIRSGEFREDLYYRFAHSVVHLAPLRQRPEEIPFLVAHALRSRDADLVVDSSFIDQCILRPWPGNVRELLATVQVAASNAKRMQNATLSASHLPPHAGLAQGVATAAAAPSGPLAASAPSPLTPTPTLESEPVRRIGAREQREEAILEAFRREPTADVAAVAAAVGVSPATVYRVLQRRAKP